MTANAIDKHASTDIALARRGFWAWLLQRVSGLFLAFFVAIHIVALHFLRQGEINASSVAERFGDGNMMIGFYAAFLIVVVFHAFNGLRGIALDYVTSPHGVRLARRTCWALGIATMVLGFIVLQSLSQLR